MTDQKWLVKFCAGDFLLDDAPQSGGPVEANNDQIETLIENNRCYTTWEIADILKISKSIKLLVKVKNVSFILQKKLNGLFGQPNACGRICTLLPASCHSFKPLWLHRNDAKVW